MNQPRRHLVAPVAQLLDQFGTHPGWRAAADHHKLLRAGACHPGAAREIRYGYSRILFLCLQCRVHARPAADGRNTRAPEPVSGTPRPARHAFGADYGRAHVVVFHGF